MGRWFVCRVRMCVHSTAWKQQVGFKAVQISSALLLRRVAFRTYVHLAMGKGSLLRRPMKRAGRMRARTHWKRGACVGLAAIIQFGRTGVRSKLLCLRSASTRNSFGLPKAWNEIKPWSLRQHPGETARVYGWQRGHGCKNRDKARVEQARHV